MKYGLNVTVAGCGTVGAGVVGMLTSRDLTRAAGCEVKLKYVVDIKDVDLPQGVELTSDFDRALEHTDILVETIGGTGIAYAYTKKALERGVSVTTSNKALVAAHGDELKRIAAENNAWYLYEASVCGGMPALRPLGTCLAGNKIESISGIVNGSTNYLITRMLTGISFSAALGEAKSQGFVEANPDDDILGCDARRKLAILASTAFNSKLSDDAFIPAKGIEKLTMEDVVSFRSVGMAVKLIAHAKMTDNGWTGWVHPALVSKNSPLYGVDGVFNGLLIKGDYVDEVMFYGRGAGMKPTASAIVGDIIEIARSLDRPFASTHASQPAFVSPDGLMAQVACRVESGCKEPDIPVERCFELDDCRLYITKEDRLGKLLDNPAFGSNGIGIPLILV
ncbi:MAG: homoserine dehydrogenase [Clostridia bacterium]|nr:homoserine dehydrogenase [Clostridia bacterium]